MTRDSLRPHGGSILVRLPVAVTSVQWTHTLGVFALAACIVGLSGCSEEWNSGSSEPVDRDFHDAGGGGGADSAADTADFDPDPDGDPDPFVPEDERTLNLPEPAAVGRFVFIANESNDTVAKVDSVTLAVTPISVGVAPRIVRANSETNVVAVLNAGSSSVSLIWPSAGRDEVLTLGVSQGANRLELDPTGRYGVAYYDNRHARRGDTIGSFQQVSVIDVEGREEFTVSVGLNVRQVIFSGDGRTLYIATDTGLSAIDVATLSDDIRSVEISLGDNPLEPPVDREVHVSDTAGLALVRTTDIEGVRLVNLETSELVEVDLGGTMSDIDLVEDGRVLLAAVRSEGIVARIDLMVDPSSPDAVVLIETRGVSPGVVVLSDDARNALLYTTVGDDPRVGVLDLERGEMSRTLVLSKAVQLVASAPGGQRAVAVHREGTASVATGDVPVATLIETSHAVSLIDLPSGYAKLVILPATPTAFTYDTNGDRFYMMVVTPRTVTRGASWGVTELDMRTFAQRDFTFESPPEAIGRVPETGQIYVSQASEVGRIAFINPSDGSVREVSGYRLNAFIE